MYGGADEYMQVYEPVSIYMCLCVHIRVNVWMWVCECVCEQAEWQLSQ